ncbi:MAG TPA: hypothetical protein VFU31_22935 [Candidatus Binatia bacterium]|nr:hypothetical protein [Candidatus Binatia bacterium]
MIRSSLIKSLLWIGGGLLIGSVVWWAVSQYLIQKEDPRSREFLSRVAAEINRSTPVMIDRETELMPSEVADGILIYNYRLVNFSVARLDRGKFTAAAKQQVTQGACAAPETRDGLLKKGVTLRYSYYDQEKKHIATVEVTPPDCGF